MLSLVELSISWKCTVSHTTQRDLDRDCVFLTFTCDNLTCSLRPKSSKRSIPFAMNFYFIFMIHIRKHIAVTD